MKTKTTFRELLQCASQTLPYIVEGSVLGFTNQIVNRMGVLGISRGELASRLKSSPAYVSKILGGGTNFTLESMVKVSEALDADLKIEMVSKNSIQSWKELMEKASPPPKTHGIWAHWKRRDQCKGSNWVGPRQLWVDDAELFPY